MSELIGEKRRLAEEAGNAELVGYYNKEIDGFDERIRKKRGQLE